ncbi:MAG TPA: cupin domain-containing protein [Kofleriaceae bacterium]|nr:cupin domain-containing protein [Kofleriaceae bacterium]
MFTLPIVAPSLPGVQSQTLTRAAGATGGRLAFLSCALDRYVTLASMRSAPVVAVAVVVTLSGTMLATTSADKPAGARREVVGLTPQQVKWFTPPYYKDGRQRAQLLGDSSKGGAWVDRVKIPGGKRVLAHTHPDDEVVTVIGGTWYLGAGERFDAARLQAYPAGSFVVIPAGVPHFVATKDGPVIVQSSGTGVFRTDFVEK